MKTKEEKEAKKCIPDLVMHLYLGFCSNPSISFPWTIIGFFHLFIFGLEYVFASVTTTMRVRCVSRYTQYIGLAVSSGPIFQDPIDEG